RRWFSAVSAYLARSCGGKSVRVDFLGRYLAGTCAVHRSHDSRELAGYAGSQGWAIQRYPGPCRGATKGLFPSPCARTSGQCFSLAVIGRGGMRGNGLCSAITSAANGGGPHHPPDERRFNGLCSAITSAA